MFASPSGIPLVVAVSPVLNVPLVGQSILKNSLVVKSGAHHILVSQYKYKTPLICLIDNVPPPAIVKFE